MLGRMNWLAALTVLMCLAVVTEGYECNVYESTFNEVINECSCKTTGETYDYNTNTCKDESSVYNSDFCGVHARATNDGCSCVNGFEDDAEGNRCTKNVDECALGGASNCMSSTEVCVDDDGQYVLDDSKGSYYCMCNQMRYRQDSNKCQMVVKQDNKQWNNCSQLARDTASDPGYECICYDNTVYDNVGDDCQLKSDYEECPSSEHVVCVVKKNSEEAKYFPKQGYKLNEANKAVDIDECESEPTCWRNSVCVNLVGEGYECRCDSGYTDALFQDTIKECLPIRCADGIDGSCSDMCSNLNCDDDFTCVPSACSTAVCGPKFESTVGLNDASVVLWAGQLTVTSSTNTFLCEVVNALESVFGAGTIQATNTTVQYDFQYTVMTTSDRLPSDFHEGIKLLTQSCKPLTTTPQYCVLPHGVIVKNTFTLDYAKDLCNSTVKDLCPTDTHECDDNIPGRYQCICKDGTGVPGSYINNYLQVCDYTVTTTTTTSTTTTIEPSTTATTPQPTTTTSTTTTIEPSTTATTPQPTTTTPTATTSNSSLLSTETTSTVDRHYESTIHNLQIELDEAKSSLTITGAVLGTFFGLSLVALAVLVGIMFKNRSSA